MPTCPQCRRHFRTLPDETQDHPCPHCGWAPWNEPRDPEEEEDDRFAEGDLPIGGASG